MMQLTEKYKNMIERLKIYVYILVITKGYGVRARTIGGPNAFAPTLCSA